MIEVNSLVYEYPTKRALHGVSFSVQPRTITALVGPNGAGKTTLLRCLAALEMPYEGEVHIDGLDTRTSPRAIHACLGYLPDFFGLYDALSVRRCLYFAARVHGIGTDKADAAVLKAADNVGLSDRLNSTAAELSRGLRQRLAIGQAIVHEPKVLMLDEPASGLDPSARRELSRLLVALKEQGMTLVVSSHILSELEDYSSEMIIIEDGQIVGGSAVKLRDASRATIHIRIAAPRDDFTEFLSAQAGVELLASTPDSATFRFLGDADARVRLLRVLAAQGFEILSFGDAPRQLEETYFS
nr:MAG: ABC transporter ATP-binding protein [Hyphomicrobiales bacterium]